MDKYGDPTGVCARHPGLMVVALLAALAGCGERQQALGAPVVPGSGAGGPGPAVLPATASGSGRVPGDPPSNLVVSTNEPFWQARVDGDQLVLAGIDTVRRMQVSSSKVEAGMRVVRAADALGDVLLTARLEPCTDDMSGAPLSLSGTLQVGDQGPHRGCARALGPPPALPVPKSRGPIIPAAFHGQWAIDASACENPHPGDGHVQVSARQLLFHENVAVPTAVQPINATTLNVALDYTGEGERWSALQALQLAGPDILAIAGPGDSITRRVRCPHAP